MQIYLVPEGTFSENSCQFVLVVVITLPKEKLLSSVSVEE